MSVEYEIQSFAQPCGRMQRRKPGKSPVAGSGHRNGELCDSLDSAPLRNDSRSTGPMGSSSCYFLLSGNRSRGARREDINPPVRPALAIAIACTADGDEEPAIADRDVRRLCDSRASYRASRRE